MTPDALSLTTQYTCDNHHSSTSDTVSQGTDRPSTTMDLVEVPQVWRSKLCFIKREGLVYHWCAKSAILYGV